MDVDSLYTAAEAAVASGALRSTGDATSPTQGATLEARPGFQMVFDGAHNVPKRRSVDLRWAAAHLLHFFCGTERAAPLRKYNDRAGRYFTGDRWVGAYGVDAMPQVHRCAELLRDSPSTRRAVVRMPPAEVHDVNRPSCWDCLHFLSAGGDLDMLVYQRSLSLAVFPYDLVLFSNLLGYVAWRCGVGRGAVVWTVGSLHAPVGYAAKPGAAPHALYVHPARLHDPEWCWRELENPTEILKEVGK